MDISPDKYIQIITNQRNNALDEAAKFASLADILSAQVDTLSKKLAEAQKRIEDLTPQQHEETANE